MVLGVKHRASCMLGKCSTVELYLQTLVWASGAMSTDTRLPWIAVLGCLPQVVSCLLVKPSF